MEKIVLPNIRKLFVPDPGYTIMEADLAGADAQVVAWEAEDEDLKAAFRAGLDVHSKNAEDMWGKAFTSLQGVARYKKRQELKKGVHATNYGTTARTIAITLNWTIHEAETFMKRWFSIHPKIGPSGKPGSWHARVQRQLDTDRTITNGFGYRRIFFDRPDACFPEALAWSPQSTVAITSFEGALQLERRQPFIQMLLQVHDSLVFQIPTRMVNKPQTDKILSDLSVPIPYPDPLTIRWGLKASPVSWGECKEVA